jgi:site-specific DNA-methyltransferase (adenine-specific)
MSQFGNKLYFGDNLQVLRESIADESVDLIYLDPPFNSKRDYNLLFKSPKGQKSEAQIEAFKDSWSWGSQAETELHDLLKQKNTDVSQMMNALVGFLGRNDMTAYLVMMAMRLLEMHRVLKPTGSLYLHCDPTASHYLKIVLDAVFGKVCYLNEITWKRTTAHNDPQRYGRITDRIFFYSKTVRKVFHPSSGDYSPEQLARYRYEKDGRRARAENLTAPHFSPTRTVEWRGTHPGLNRQWRFSAEELDRLLAEGRIILKANGCPRKDGLLEFLDEMEGPAMQDIWLNLTLGPTSDERLGYPTQKPLALLERIIAASSNKGDLVLDPFCGCGTAVHAAQKLERKWIGIDITHLAISLIEKRLKDAFGTRCKFHVHGTPQDFAAARDLAARDKYQFQWWAVSLVEAQPYQGIKKGADGGIDGLKFFHDMDNKGARKIVVSVKGGGLKADDVRALNHVRNRESAEIALFISLETPTKGMIAEAASAGFYTSAVGKTFSRVQLLTIEGLLSGTTRAQHPDHLPDLNFKKAKAEPASMQKTLL